MKSTIHKCCKTLAATAIAASLSISLGVSTASAQEAPPKRKAQQNIELQKVDGPRKTGRTRPTGKNQIQQIDRADKQRQLLKGAAGHSEAAQPSDPNRSKSAPTIQRLDPEKVRELRSRIRTERNTRIRDTQFQEERTKNIRRLVQIERIRELAEQNQNQQLLDRANELRDKEIQRHTRRLAQLRHEGTERRQFNQRQRNQKPDPQQVQ